MKVKIKSYFVNLLIIIVRFILKIFYIFQVNDKSILFISYDGLQYSCNPKYISEYILGKNTNNLELYWVFRDINKFDYLKCKYHKIIKYRSFEYLKYFLTSKVLITNTSFPSFIPFRKEQLLINTWHGGGAYKKIILDNKVPIETKKIYSHSTDLFLSTSKLSSDLIIRDTFNFKGKILEVGYPRNDIFFKDTYTTKIKVFNYYSIDLSEKIVLYAPTYRKNTNKETYALEVDKIINQLFLKFGGSWKVFVRAHHFIKSNFDFNDNKNLINVSDYDDMQELLCSADLLITDYSSCIWDFSLMLKPSILLLKDLNEYKNERNFYVPIEMWNIPIALNNEELIEIISKLDIVSNKINIQKHFDYFGSFETGKACQEVDKIISGYIL